MSTLYLVMWLLLAVLGFFSICWVIIAVVHRVRDVLFSAEMARKNKLMEWKCFFEKAKSGQGTIVINNSNLPGFLWYVERKMKDDNHDALEAMRADGVFVLSPFPLFLSEKLIRRTFPLATIVRAVGVIRKHPMSDPGQ